MSLSRKQQTFSVMVARLIIWAYEHGYGVTFGEAWRSKETQHTYVQRGLSKTEDSEHLNRLAVDLNLFINGEYITDPEAYRPLGEMWEDLGGRWGGRFGVIPAEYRHKVGWDPGHFEYGRGEHPVSQL